MKFSINYLGVDILDLNSGNNSIYSLLSNDAPCMVSRAGATEMRCLGEFLHPHFDKSFSSKIKKEIKELSGVFPATDQILLMFCEEYLRCIEMADMLALWGVGAESKVVHRYCHKSTQYVQLRSLEPYYFSSPWTKSLAGLKVLVVHPFVDSITSQYEKREKIFPNGKDVLPLFQEIICIRAVQSAAGENADFDDWFAALEYMKNKISLSDFDVAIIGAGAYSLPLAAFVKSIGKKAVQLSGATQILFGIKGRRWDNHAYIGKLYNEHWVRPNESEVPRGSVKVEGGCYW
jgi:hypothetical protein